MTATEYTTVGVNNEPMLVMYPKQWKKDGTRPGIIFSHGYLGDALECRQPNLPESNLLRVLEEVVNAGYPVISGFFGGNHWGNAQAITKIDAAASYLANTMGASSAKVGIYAQSMGHLAAMNWTAQNRGRVGAVVSSIGVANLANINTQSAYTASITSAYGKAYTDAEFGTTYNPYINTSSKYSGLNWLGWAGTDDTVCPVGMTQNFAANIGSTALVRTMQGGTHSWETISMVDKYITADFYRTNLG